MTNPTKHDKTNMGFWLLKQAVLDLLNEPQNQAGMRATAVKDALGFPSGTAEGLLKQMEADGDLVSDKQRHPTYSIPSRNRQNRAN